MFTKLSLCAVLTALMFAPIAAQAQKPADAEKSVEHQTFLKGFNQLSDAEKMLMRTMVVNFADKQIQQEVANNPALKEFFQSIHIVLQQENTIAYQMELQDDVSNMMQHNGQAADTFAQMFTKLTENTMCQKTQHLHTLKTLGFSHFAVQLTHQGKTLGQSRHALPDCATPAQ
ncbi:hypothetical protein LNQ82_08875 [Conchiformibius steedae DSM 2580]|uniref:Uncharacterized protein n=1 Tax=Conchiformibius steedae DSM 2580 TaxID=1121352 RepID=A0AAE9HT75_9NEIS|nr:hypothetical protein [Conchiformibius steedae]QMT32679.1 hypothetical protein H3L98_05975 [Conchiformibius steedae]URD67288.1 hypothetical protein LNQ82_08875 [Conchiformibius steedae DSM 2580]